jgi:hypothetical protein
VCTVCEFCPDERWGERRERKIGGFTLREGLVRYVWSASVDVEGLLVTVRRDDGRADWMGCMHVLLLVRLALRLDVFSGYMAGGTGASACMCMLRRLQGWC